MSEILKTSDLRISNLVKSNNPKYRPSELGKFLYVTKVDSENDSIGCFVFEELPFAINFGQYTKFIEGIPITSEILLACGYSDCGFRENHFVIKGHSIWKCNEMFLCDKNGVVLKTLHQLQNLYFALNNQELEFKTELK